MSTDTAKCAILQQQIVQQDKDIQRVEMVLHKRINKLEGDLGVSVDKMRTEYNHLNAMLQDGFRAQNELMNTLLTSLSALQTQHKTLEGLPTTIATMKEQIRITGLFIKAIAILILAGFAKEFFGIIL